MPEPRLTARETAIGGYLSLLHGSAPVPRSRPRLRPTGRGLRRAAAWLDHLAVHSRQVGANLESLADQARELAYDLDPRPYRHTLAPAASSRLERFAESILEGGRRAGRRAQDAGLSAFDEFDEYHYREPKLPGVEPAVDEALAQACNPVDWQAGTPSDELAARAEVVKEGTGWGVPPRRARVGVDGEPPRETTMEDR